MAFSVERHLAHVGQAIALPLIRGACTGEYFRHPVIAADCRLDALRWHADFQAVLAVLGTSISNVGRRRGPQWLGPMSLATRATD